MRLVGDFETVVLSRADLPEWPSLLRQFRTRMESSEIKIVDIRRRHDELIITFRNLQAQQTGKRGLHDRLRETREDVTSAALSRDFV